MVISLIKIKVMQSTESSADVADVVNSLSDVVGLFASAKVYRIIYIDCLVKYVMSCWIYTKTQRGKA